MLKSIELENFKAFGARVKIPLAPITLIFGENSAGKSSILQALNLLKQTRESRESGALLLPKAESGFANLGSFQDMLFDHDLTRSLSIRIETSVDLPKIRSFVNRYWLRIGEDSVAMEMTFKRPSLDDEISLESLKVFFSDPKQCIAMFEPTKVSKQIFNELSFHFRRDRRPIPTNIRAAKCAHVIDHPDYWEQPHQWFRQTRQDIIANLKTDEKMLQRGENIDDSQASLFEEDLEESQYRQRRLARLRNAIDFYSSDFDLNSYISRMVTQQKSTIIGLDGFIPFGISQRDKGLLPQEMIFRYRPGAPRYNEITIDVGRIALFAGRTVEQTLGILFPLGPFRRPPERWYIFTGTSPQDVGYQGDLLPDLLFRHPEFVQEANDWLIRLGVGYQLKVESLGPQVRDLFEVRLIDTRRSNTVGVGLPDVGFGISQLLPFIVQSLASRGKIVSVEQPEVHIHPKLQADIGDLLSESIKPPRQNQFIIETHSEHLILRLQKLIREKILKPTDVSIIYVSRGSDGATVQRLNLDDDGDFVDEWPGGFFPERLRELR